MSKCLAYHSADRSRGHVGDEASEESLAGKISVVLLHVLSSWGSQLHGHQLVALLLESLDDFAHQSSLDAIRLDHDVCERKQI